VCCPAAGCSGAGRTRQKLSLRTIIGASEAGYAGGVKAVVGSAETRLKSRISGSAPLAGHGRVVSHRHGQLSV